MVQKEEFCEWFKDLHPPKRLDYLCCLLHVCLPIELRFVSSVLEDLCKKDNDYLRDRDVFSNDPARLSDNQSYCLSDPDLRHKLLIALALINSTNSKCLEIINNILKRPENHLNNLSDTTLMMKDAADEIELILTMALHHPAIKFAQKLDLGEILKSFQDRIHQFHGGNMERDLLLPPPSQVHNVPMFKKQTEKGPLMSIEVIAIRESNYRKGGQEHQIHATWSNGDVSEVFMKFKPLQDVHHNLVYKFTEFRKQHTSNVPVFPGKQQYLKETEQEKINSLNSYFRELMKAPTQVAKCELWPEAMRKGNTIQQQQIVIPQQQYYIPRKFYDDQNNPTTWPPQYTLPHMARLPFCSNNSSSGHLTSPSQLSSNTESPINSRTSSPALAPQYYSSNQTSPGSVTNGALLSPVLSQDLADQISNNQQCLKQLLRILDMEKSYEHLCHYSVKQVMSMSKAEFAKAGLPLDAQEKLHSRLDHWNKTQPENGLLEEPSFQVLQLQPAPYMPGSPLLPAFVQPYPQHPSPVLLASLVTGSDSSTANSEVSSPPASPSQLAIAALDSPLVASTLPDNSIDHTILPMVGRMMNVASNCTSDIKTHKKNYLSPGDTDMLVSDTEDEEEDHSTLNGEIESNSKSSSQRKATEVVSDPDEDVNSGSVARPPSVPASIDSSTDLGSPGSSPALPPASVSPQMHISTVATGPQVNGFLSDPPPLMHQNIRPILNQRPYKGAQPTHTAPGMHKNVVNMPSFELRHHIPQPVGQPVCKGVGMLPPGLHSMTHHTYMAPPSVTTATSNQGVQGIIMGPGNHQTNNNNILPQQHQSHQMTGHPPDPPNNFHYPQLILRPPGMGGPMHPQRSVFPASTGSVMTTTQSHSVGPPSQSPSPVTTVVPTDKAPPLPAGTIYLPVADLSMDRAATGTPPNQPLPNLANKPPSTAPSSGTNTPSPPLINPAQPNKPHSANCINCDHTSNASGAPPQVYFQQVPSYMYQQIMTQAHNPNNGLVTPMPPYFHHTQAQAHYPNGISHEHYMAAAAAARFPHPQGQVNPMMYGNSFPGHNQMLSHGTLQTGVPPPMHNGHGHNIHNNQGHNGQGHNGQGHSGQGHSVQVHIGQAHAGQRHNGLGLGPHNANGHSNKTQTCYNCGYSGHRAAECKESTMASETASEH